MPTMRSADVCGFCGDPTPGAAHRFGRLVCQGCQQDMEAQQNRARFQAAATNAPLSACGLFLADGHDPDCPLCAYVRTQPAPAPNEAAYLARLLAPNLAPLDWWKRGH